MDIGVHDNARLAELQALPLQSKVGIAAARITEFVQHFGEDGCYVSFSGGKDSTVLVDIVSKLYPSIPIVFSDTGLEYPEVREFARSKATEVVRPKMNFVDVIREYGYPIITKEVSEAIYYARRNRTSQSVNVERERERERVRPQSASVQSCKEQGTTHVTQKNIRRLMLMGSFASADGKAKSKFNKQKWLPLAQLPFRISNRCCSVLKKSPLQIYQRATKRFPIIATMACESSVRRQAWLRTGCNAFDGNHISCKPMSVWLEQDVLEYINTFGLQIASVYGEIIPKTDGQCELCTTGCSRTGCIWCLFGTHLEKDDNKRLVRLKQTHPKQYDYCMRGGAWVDNPDYIEGLPEYDGTWKNWNPKKIWMPDGGLGYAKMIDMINETYGKELIAY